jgi:hypothetical protein
MMSQLKCDRSPVSDCAVLRVLHCTEQELLKFFVAFPSGLQIILLFVSVFQEINLEFPDSLQLD